MLNPGFLWVARIAFLAVLLWQLKNFIAPEANRQSALRRFERHPWMASPTFRRRFAEASVTRLRISALLQFLIAAVALWYTFAVAR